MSEGRGWKGRGGEGRGGEGREGRGGEGRGEEGKIGEVGKCKIITTPVHCMSRES